MTSIFLSRGNRFGKRVKTRRSLISQSCRTNRYAAREEAGKWRYAPLLNPSRHPGRSLGGWQLGRMQAAALLGDRRMLSAVGKTALLLCSIVLGLDIWLGHVVGDLENALHKVDNTHHELIENQIRLMAHRKTLFSPEHVRIMAAEKFSLAEPEKGQVEFL